MQRADTFWTFVTNVTIMLLGVANSVVLSRWMGPIGRGEVAAAMLWPVLLIYVGSAGIIPSTLYFSSRDTIDSNIILGNAWLVALALGLLSIMGGYIVMPWLLTSQTVAVISASRLYLLVIPVSLLTQCGVSVLQGNQCVKVYNIFRLIIPFGYLIGSLVLFAVDILNVRNVIALHLFLNIIALICLVVVLFFVKLGVRFCISLSLINRLIKYGLKIQVGDISQSANLRLDQVLMAIWLSPYQLGIYVVAVSSASFAQLLSTSVGSILLPKITQKKTVEDRLFILQLIFKQYWVLSIAITLALGVVLPLAIPIIYGSDFRASIIPAEFLTLGVFFLGAKNVLSVGAQALGNPWLGSRSELISLFVTIILLLTLLPSIGINGAVIATIASYVIQLLIMVCDLRRLYAIRIRSFFLPDYSGVKKYIQGKVIR